MDKVISEEFLLSLLLAHLRIVLFVFFLPFFSAPQIPFTVRLYFSVALSLSLLLYADLPPLEVEATEEILLLALNELLFGFVSVLILRLVFEAVVVAGEIVAVHTAMGFLQIFIPGQPQMSLFSAFFSLYGTLLFLSIGGAEIVLLALAESLRSIPPGSFNLFSLNPEVFLRFFYESFSLGVKLSLPVLMTALLLNMVLAVVNRFIPQMNVFMVGLPLQVILGLLVLLLSLPVIGYSLSDHFIESLREFVGFITHS